MNDEEEIFIRDAVRFLDRPSFLVRLANTLGKPMELAVRTLPAKQQQKIHRATQMALKKGLVVVTKTMGEGPKAKSFARSNQRSRRVGRWHSATSFGLGTVGGFFGMLSLPVELPLTTAVILRSIASIADEFGMDLNDPQTQLECLYILSLGAPETKDDDAMNSAYWSSRAAFSRLADEAARFLASKTTHQLSQELERRSAPILMRFIAQVAARFEVVVSEKMMAEAVPIIGAIGGGMINAAFTDYFSEVARYHFGLRALEVKHGREAIEGYSTRIRERIS